MKDESEIFYWCESQRKRQRKLQPSSSITNSELLRQGGRILMDYLRVGGSEPLPWPDGCVKGRLLKHARQLRKKWDNSGDDVKGKPDFCYNIPHFTTHHCPCPLQCSVQPVVLVPRNSSEEPEGEGKEHESDCKDNSCDGEQQGEGGSKGHQCESKDHQCEGNRLGEGKEHYQGDVEDERKDDDPGEGECRDGALLLLFSKTVTDDSMVS